MHLLDSTISQTPLQIRLLGLFDLQYKGQAATRFRSDKARAMVAYLAMHADQPIRRERLATLLWGELDQSRARANLRNTLSNLRSLLPPEAITITRQTCQLNDAALSLDVAAFLDGDLDQYRGEFLAGLNVPDALEFSEWRIVTQEQLHLRAMQQFEQAQADSLQADQHQQAALLAKRQLALEPWHEKANYHLIKALIALDQHEAARTHFVSYKQVLASELGVGPSDQISGLIEALSAETPHPQHSSLPAQTTPFFGRITELKRIHALLSNSKRRWLTLVGMGGIGKTRLAQQSGAAAAEDRLFLDGVCFVALAGVTAEGEAAQEAAIAQAMSDALRMRLQGQDSAETQLTRHLQDKAVLLILDNFEQLIEGGGLVNRLVSRLPGLSVLCTSREALGYRAEMVLPVGGLDVPVDEPGQSDDDERPALALFSERAEAATGDFELNAATRPTVVHICRWVGGSPLGIELAAAGLRSNTLPEIWDALQSGYRNLRAQLRDIPARQRSMQTVFHYSWALLDEQQQDLLAQLAVFRGPFSAQAAQAVTQQPQRLLGELCQRSLLNQQTDGRYWLHEMLRQFSAEKLTPHPLSNKAAANHASFYLKLLVERQAELIGHAPQRVRDEIIAAQRNVQKAWPVALSSAEPAPLCAAIRAYSTVYQLGGYQIEAEQLFSSTATTLAQRNDADKAVAYALIEQTRFQLRLSRYFDALTTAQRALGFSDDGWVQGMGRVLLGEANWRLGEFAEAERVLHEALAIGRAQAQPVVEGWSLHHLGISADIQAKHSQARDYLQQAVTIWEQINFARAKTVTYASIGIVASNQQEFAAAASALGRAVALNAALDDKYQQTYSLISLASAHERLEDTEKAYDILQQAEQLAQRLNNRDMLMRIAFNIGFMALGDGDTARAHAQLEAAHRLSCEIGNAHIETESTRLLQSL